MSLCLPSAGETTAVVSGETTLAPWEGLVMAAR